MRTHLKKKTTRGAGAGLESKAAFFHNAGVSGRPRSVPPSRGPSARPGGRGPGGVCGGSTRASSAPLFLQRSSDAPRERIVEWRGGTRPGQQQRQKRNFSLHSVAFVSARPLKREGLRASGNVNVNLCVSLSRFGKRKALRVSSHGVSGPILLKELGSSLFPCTVSGFCTVHWKTPSLFSHFVMLQPYAKIYRFFVSSFIKLHSIPHSDKNSKNIILETLVHLLKRKN